MRFFYDRRKVCTTPHSTCCKSFRAPTSKLAFAPVLNTAVGRFQIVGSKCVVAFITRIGQESGQLRYVREILGLTALRRGDGDSATVKRSASSWRRRQHWCSGLQQSRARDSSKRKLHLSRREEIFEEPRAATLDTGLGTSSQLG